MNAITTGLDIAKSVFQAHGEDAEGRIVFQKKLRRGQVEAFFAKLPASVIGIEACGTSHYWGRTLRVLGHEVKLIPADAEKRANARLHIGHEEVQRFERPTPRPRFAIARPTVHIVPGMTG